MPIRRLLLIATVAFLAALGGVWGGRVLLPHRPVANDLHALLHDQLDLTPGQHAQLDVIEEKFAPRRKALELEMRAGNARLAEAIALERSFGPRVSAAIDQLHVTMGELQKETLAHVFAMRAVLRPDQAAKFDRVVVKALTDPQP